MKKHYYRRLFKNFNSNKKMYPTKLTQQEQDVLTDLLRKKMIGSFVIGLLFGGALAFALTAHSFLNLIS